jgi:hypothetical protein
MKIALTYLISGRVYGQGRGVSIEAGMAFRSASIDGGEVTLWVDAVEKGLALIGEQ